MERLRTTTTPQVRSQPASAPRMPPPSMGTDHSSPTDARLHRTVGHRNSVPGTRGSVAGGVTHPRRKDPHVRATVRSDPRSPGSLRPALRRLRPGPGPHRGRVDQGHHRQGRRQRRPRLPHPRHPDQGAAGGARQAPPLGAVDRLLQAAALREVPAAPPAGERGHQARRRHRRQGLARRRRSPTTCWRRSTRSPKSSGRPRSPECSPVTLSAVSAGSAGLGTDTLGSGAGAPGPTSRPRLDKG